MDFSKPSTFLKVLLGVLALVIALLFITSDGSGIGTYGVNKTIGWAWQIAENSTIVVLLISVVIVALSIIQYLILALVKLKINKYVAVTHLISILLLIGTSIVVTGIGFHIPILLLAVSVTLLVVNAIVAIVEGLKKKNNLHL